MIGVYEIAAIYTLTGFLYRVIKFTRKVVLQANFAKEVKEFIMQHDEKEEFPDYYHSDNFENGANISDLWKMRISGEIDKIDEKLMIRLKPKINVWDEFVCAIFWPIPFIVVDLFPILKSILRSPFEMVKIAANAFSSAVWKMILKS